MGLIGIVCIMLKPQTGWVERSLSEDGILLNGQGAVFDSFAEKC